MSGGKSNSKTTQKSQSDTTMKTPGTDYGTALLGRTSGLQDSVFGAQPFSGDTVAAPIMTDQVAQWGQTPSSYVPQRSTADAAIRATKDFVAPNAQEGIDAGMAAANGIGSWMPSMTSQARDRWTNILQGDANPELANLINLTQADWGETQARAQGDAALNFGNAGAYGGTEHYKLSQDMADRATRSLNLQTSGLRAEDFYKNQQMLAAAPSALRDISGLETLPAELLSRYGGMRQTNLEAGAANEQANQNIVNQNQWLAGGLNDDNLQRLAQDAMARWNAEHQSEEARVANDASKATIQQGINQAGLSNPLNQYQMNQDNIARQLANSQALMQLARSVPGASTSTTATGSGTSKQSQVGFDLGSESAMKILSAIFGSDRRLKKDIVPAMRDSRGLQWYKYRYIWDHPAAPLRMGVMADEVRSVVPEAVMVDPAGFLMVDYGAL